MRSSKGSEAKGTGSTISTSEGDATVQDRHKRTLVFSGWASETPKATIIHEVHQTLIGAKLDRLTDGAVSRQGLGGIPRCEESHADGDGGHPAEWHRAIAVKGVKSA